MTGRSLDPERASARVQAIAEALGRLGEPITEAQAREIAPEQQCDCQEGMFALAPTRRSVLGSAGLVAAVGATVMLPRTTFAKTPPGAVEYQVPEDPTKEPGRLMGVGRHCHGNRVGSPRRIGYDIGMAPLGYRRHRFPPECVNQRRTGTLRDSALSL